MSIDFNKHASIAKTQKHGPHKIYCIEGIHPESENWIEACFFYKSEAEQALEWVENNMPQHDGHGGDIFHRIIETRLTRWKGE